MKVKYPNPFNTSWAHTWRWSSSCLPGLKHKSSLGGEGWRCSLVLSLTHHLRSTSSSQRLLLRPNWGCFGVGPSSRQSQEHRWIWRAAPAVPGTWTFSTGKCKSSFPSSDALCICPYSFQGDVTQAEFSRVGNSCKLMKTRVWRKEKALPLLITGRNIIFSKKKRPAAHESQHHELPRLILNLPSSWCHEQHTRRGDRGDKDLGEAGDINVLRIQRTESCGTTF